MNVIPEGFWLSVLIQYYPYVEDRCCSRRYYFLTTSLANVVECMSIFGGVGDMCLYVDILTFLRI